MFGLPKSTDLNKPLPKTAIYKKFQLCGADKDRIDNDISRIYIVNEVSASNTNISEGKDIKSFFVMSVLLKRKDFNEKSIIMLSKLIPQNILMVLEYENEAKLVTYCTKLLQTEWLPKDELSVELKGIDMDSVWENIIKSLEGGVWNDEISIEANLAKNAEYDKINKEIARLEKRIRAERQPKKKFELANKIKQLKQKLEEI